MRVMTERERERARERERERERERARERVGARHAKCVSCLVLYCMLMY
jgi:hypothetical protein